MYTDCIASKGIIKFSLSNNVPKVNININVECPNERLSNRNIKNFKSVAFFLLAEGARNVRNVTLFLSAEAARNVRSVMFLLLAEEGSNARNIIFWLSAEATTNVRNVSFASIVRNVSNMFD